MIDLPAFQGGIQGHRVLRLARCELCLRLGWLSSAKGCWPECAVRGFSALLVHWEGG